MPSALRVCPSTPGRAQACDVLLTALAPAVWGSTYLVTTELLPPGRPLLASAVRALPAGLVLLAIGRRLPHGAWWWRAAVLGALNIGVFFYLLFVAAYHLPGGVAALVVAVQPMIVLLLGAVLLKEPIRPAQVTACVLGVAGVALLALTPRADIDATGIVAGLAAAVSMAVGIVLTKLWGRPAGIGVLTFTGWQLTAGGLLLAPVTLAAEGLPTRVTMRQHRGLRVSVPDRGTARLRRLVPRNRTATGPGGVDPGFRQPTHRNRSRIPRPRPGPDTPPTRRFRGGRRLRRPGTDLAAATRRDTG